jgi:predicted Fe-S protein YdhL (DUF1289 family)
VTSAQRLVIAGAGVSSVDDAAVASPCIAVCRLAADGICDGCGRSIDEIVAWRDLSVAGKRAVIATAQARRATRS